MAAGITPECGSVSRIERLAAIVTERRRAVVASVLVASLLLGAGAATVDVSASLAEFRGGTPEAAAHEYVEANFSDGRDANTTTTVIVLRRDDALSKGALLDQLGVLRALQANETVNSTLAPERPPVGFASYVATTAVRERQNRSITDTEPLPPLRVQRETLRSLNDSALESDGLRTIRTVLSNVSHTWPDGGPFAFLPRDYSLGEEPNATALVVTQRESTTPAERLASQTAMRAIADREGRGDALVFGKGIVNDELERSAIDSALLVGPIALLLVIAIMALTYRDPLDVALGLFGVGLVLVWTFGFMGWAGITFNQLFVAVPALLIGLSVDYGIHAVMRYREARGDDGSGSSTGGGSVVDTGGGIRATDRATGTDAGTTETATGATAGDGRTDARGWEFGDGNGDGGDAGDERDASNDDVTGGGESDGGGSSEETEREMRRTMWVALSSLGGALVLVTITTATGFAANLVSGVEPIREFGVVSAVGIVATLVVFGALVPALKVELDAALAARGYDRRRRALGADGGRLGRALAGSVTAARAAPRTVIALALVVSTVGFVGAGAVDTSFAREDLLIEEGDVPEWAETLPEPFAPGEYRAKTALDYVSAHFLPDGKRAEVLLRGNVTRPGTIDRFAQLKRNPPNGNYGIFPGSRTRSPLSVMRAVAERNRSFARTLAAADTDGDRSPDRNLTRVYDALFATAPAAAAEVIYREDGEYRALRLSTVAAGRSNAAITEGARGIADQLDDGSTGGNATGGDSVGDDGDGRTAIATGEPVMLQAVAAKLLDTAAKSLAVTLAVVLAVLLVAYRLTTGHATLGVVTLLPVTMALTWILGTMALLGVPFTVVTAVITSFTIGIGVDYSIHVSERYVGELDRGRSVREALGRSVTGTGGALLGSAATDVAGAAVLVFAILTPLRQFGVVMSLTVIYTLLASVIVLPSLLVAWTRWAGPDALAGATSTAAD
ncbi:Patched family protein [Halobacteriales archaeon QS_4_69_34]|nr:MAG: Patched family protein [Halobacteriales archaeon QS_4_69_34]